MLFFLKDNKKEFILWLNVPKVTAYVNPLSLDTMYSYYAERHAKNVERRKSMVTA